MQFFLTNTGHLIPYAILLLTYLFLSLQSELLRNKLFAMSALGLLLLFAGFREVMTPDMERYREMYENIGALNFLAIEPSFLFLSKFLSMIGFDYHALFFAYTSITLAFIYLGLKNYTNQIKLSLLLYILLPACFLNMFVEMREVSAVAIAFYAASILRRDSIKFRFFKCLFFAILSVLFHYSAILYWVIFLVFYRTIKRSHSSITYLLFIISSLLIPTSVLMHIVQVTAYPFLPSKYQGYVNLFMELEAHQVESGQLLKSLIYVLLAMCFIYWSDEDSYHVPLNLFIIGVIILNLTRSFADVSRLAYFFLIYQIVIFPALVVKVKNRGGQLLAAYSLVLFYLAQFVWGLFFYSDEAGSYVFLHYQNVVLSALR